MEALRKVISTIPRWDPSSFKDDENSN